MNEIERVVIRFSGDSGDGMQLTGTQFSDTSALMENDIATFPDFPAEIRAPKGSIAGVSGFQVQFGAIEINTPGDAPDVLVAMNPAALKANLDSVEKGKTLIINTDAFSELNLKKAKYEKNPLEDGSLDDFQIIKAPITTLTREALKDLELDGKSKDRCKNFFALGMTYFIFTRQLKHTQKWIDEKFAKLPLVAEANKLALKAGYDFSGSLQLSVSTYTIPPAKKTPGLYKQINGNTGLALGFVQASRAAGINLFLGSYPITPASDILHELSKHKSHGVITVQAEDEIAGVCSAIGASFGGALSLTTTSGPGLALKGEAMGLATIYEIPLVVVDVQRGGPSTGLPTKTEQSDLSMAFYGRNGECPMIILACSRPNDCFEMAFEASRLALEHMTPVLLLSDGFIANGSEPWLLPDDFDKTYPKINHHQIGADKIAAEYLPYSRDENTLVRNQWAIPGTKGGEHVLGGLEKQAPKGNVSYDPLNHQEMTRVRQAKVDLVANNIPEQEVFGDESGDLLVLSWGGTYGSNFSAVKNSRAKGMSVSHTHLRYLNPFPKNLAKILSSYKKVLIPELNSGQLRGVIASTFHIDTIGYNKVQGLPFKVSELEAEITRILEAN